VDVQDLGSKNGIMVGTARVNQARLVADASHFQLGRSLVTLHGVDLSADLPPVEPVDGLIGSEL
jgi:pSer/pThr/pTyr-binding forkhead associated (FHA) protein